jgi:hypothetical protein
MVELIQQQRHFLHLIKSTTTAQRKALFKLLIIFCAFKYALHIRRKLNLNVKDVLFMCLETIDFKQNRDAIHYKPRVIYTLVKITFAYLEPVLA